MLGLAFLDPVTQSINESPCAVSQNFLLNHCAGSPLPAQDQH